MDNIDNIVIDNASLVLRNFSGKAIPPYTPEGQRSFSVKLDVETALQLANAGWNVKIKALDDGTEVVYLRVYVAFDKPQYPVKIVQLIVSDGVVTNKTYIAPESVGNIDFLDIENIKLEIRPRVWTNQRGESGVKAYLKTMYYELVPDIFESMYTYNETINNGTDDTLPFDV